MKGKTMKMTNNPTRRDFLRSSAVAGAAFISPFFVPSSVFGANAPSNRIAIGCIGVGGMGMNDLKALISKPQTQVLAVCDVEAGSKDYGGYYKGRDLGREPAKRYTEKYYAEKAPSGTYKGCAAYIDFRELLARGDIDAVTVVTPDQWHVPMSVAAARAGKDIYCEKPLTLTIKGGRVLADTVKRYGRILQTGSMQRSAQEFRFACELVRNGRIGKLHTIEVGIPGNNVKNPLNWKPEPIPDGLDYDMWLGPAPDAPYTKMRCHYTFRFILDYSGGQMTNWGAHYLDIAQWGNNTDDTGPVEIDGKGEFPSEGLFNTATKADITYTYANGVKLHLKTGGGHTRFIGTDGWIMVSRGKIKAGPESILKSKIRPNEIHLYKSGNHIQNFLDCIKTRKDPICTAEIGHRSASLCHLGNISMLLGRKIKWDPKKEQFKNDPEADSMVSRNMRVPWRL
jgi:predicted dehydrogenase